MSWAYFFIVLAIAIAYIYFKRAGQIPKKEAFQYLKSGAMVIDVRTPNEFNSGHLLQAYNMPLDRIDVLAPGTVRDKNKVLLLHCTTGIRSNLARKRLLDLGYKNVFNLGSYDRAERIVSGHYL
jgi:phage shock protein E